MTDRRWLVGGWIWSGLFVLGGLSLVVAVDRSPLVSHYEYAVEGLIFSVVMTVLGSIILVPRPRQPIGLVLFIAGVAAATQFGAGEYAILAVERGWLAGASAAWLATLLRTPVFLLSFGLLVLLYPSGRPLGRWGHLLVAFAVEALSRRLSSEVDLAELGRDLERVAGQTMEPSNVSVWVRERNGIWTSR